MLIAVNTMIIISILTLREKSIARAISIFLPNY
jgi:hypothetical protein